MSRSRSGSLWYRRGWGYVLRVTVDIVGGDGIPRTKRRDIDLETHDMAQAVAMQRRITAHLEGKYFEDVKVPGNLNFEPIHPPSIPGVYFVRASDRVKIGTSKNIASRIASLQTASPERLELLAFTPGGVDVERMYHEMFAASRIHREWFRMDGQVTGCILRLRAEMNAPRTIGPVEENDNGEDPWCDAEPPSECRPQRSSPVGDESSDIEPMGVHRSRLDVVAELLLDALRNTDDSGEVVS